MTKLVLYALMSLDGAVDNPHLYFPETGDGDGAPVFDQELADHETDMIKQQTAVILGRGMYEQWSRYWPTAAEEPFAGFINRVRKYIVTSRPLTTDWPNAEPVSGPLDVLVADLKARTDGDLGVHGSITLAHSLLAQGLVDELCLAVGRVIDPRGRRLFETMTVNREMQLIDAQPTPSGSMWLRYAVLS